MKKDILKVIYLLTLCLLSSSILSAQEEEKKEKRVYYLDCSYSMLGNLEKPEDNIWESVKNNLKRAINNISDESTEIWVIPFAQNSDSYQTLVKKSKGKGKQLLLKGKCEFATEKGKKSLIDYIDRIENPTRETMTYHIIPMRDFEQRCDSTKENYMFLMTDGKDEHPHKKNYNGEEFNKKLDAWHETYKNIDAYCIYVLLKEKENDEIREKKIAKTNRCWQLNTAIVDINTVKLSEHIDYNLNKDTVIEINYKGNLKDVKFKYNLDSVAPFRIIRQEITDKSLKLHVQRKKNLNLKNLKDSQVFKLKIKQDEQDRLINKNKYSLLITEEIKINCTTKKNIIKFSETVNYNVRKDSIIKIKCEVGKLNGLKLNIETEKDAPFKIIKYDFETNNLKLHVHPKENSIYTLEDSTRFNLYISQSSDDFTYISNQNITVNCSNKKEKVLIIKSSNDIQKDNNVLLGKIKYYSPFLWSHGTISPVKIDINFEFNNDAQYDENTFALFDIVDESGKPFHNDILSITCGKEIIKNDSFKIDCNIKSLTLTFYGNIQDNSKTLQGYFKLINHNLKRVNNKNNLIPGQPTDVFHWSIEYEKMMNPLLKWIIGIIGGILLIIFINKYRLWSIYRNAPKFPSQWNIDFRSSNNINLLPKSKCNKNLEYGRGTICIVGSSTIYTNLLNHEYIKEINIYTGVTLEEQKVRNKIHGDTINIDCDFGIHNNISKITLIPGDNQITIYIKKTNEPRPHKYTIDYVNQAMAISKEINSVNNTTLDIRMFTTPLMN